MRATDRRLQSAFLGSTALSVMGTDAGGVVRIFNAGAERMLGYTGAEVLNRLTPADLCDDVKAMLADAARGDEARREITFIRKDGRRVGALACLIALRDSAGEITGHVLIALETKPAHGDAAAPEPLAGARAAACQLLYVEDDPESLALIEQLMSRRDAGILHCAVDARAALELVRLERPEAILLNIDLPGLDALQFIKRVRTQPAARNTPILALSANGAPGAVMKALEDGFFRYLASPLAAGPFMEALEHALEFAACERAEENPLPSRAAHLQPEK